MSSHDQNLDHDQYASVVSWILLQDRDYVNSLWLHFQ